MCRRLRNETVGFEWVPLIETVAVDKPGPQTAWVAIGTGSFVLSKAGPRTDLDWGLIKGRGSVGFIGGSEME